MPARRLHALRAGTGPPAREAKERRLSGRRSLVNSSGSAVRAWTLPVCSSPTAADPPPGGSTSVVVALVVEVGGARPVAVVEPQPAHLASAADVDSSDGQNLTAVIVSNIPVNLNAGSVTLNSDGSFTYNPEPNQNFNTTRPPAADRKDRHRFARSRKSHSSQTRRAGDIESISNRATPFSSLGDCPD